METRTITQVRLYKLILNPMQAPQIEIGEIVAVSTEYEKLVEWYKSQLAPEPWRDGRWYKVFAEGTPLEWYNPENIELNAPCSFGHGIKDEWVTEETYLNVVSGNFFPVV